MRTLASSIVLVLVLAWGGVGGASAQAGEELPAVPPPPPSYPEPSVSGPVTEPAPAPDPSTACVPACRSGFTCVEGQCVSACNPPCAAGERCTASGECSVPASTPYAEPAPSFIEPAPPFTGPDGGAERHDGFMLRMALAFGGSVMTESLDAPAIGATSFEYSGFALGFSLDLGASPTDDLVIHARLADVVNPSPSVSMDGTDLGEAQDLSLIANLFGVGITYYFMPINFYVTGVIGPSWLTLSDQTSDTSDSSDVGFGLNLDLGKEWWVSDNWGLGLAGRFWLTTLEHQSDSAVPVDYMLLAFGVAFSATYQ